MLNSGKNISSGHIINQLYY